MQETWQFIIRKGNNNSWRIYYMPGSRLNLSPVSSVLKSCIILFACLMCGWDFKGLNEFLKFSQLVNGRGGVLSQVIWPKRQLRAHHTPLTVHTHCWMSHTIYIPPFTDGLILTYEYLEFVSVEINVVLLLILHFSWWLVSPQPQT